MRAPRFWQDGGWPALLLAPIGAGVTMASRLRRLFITPYEIDIPVICIGNVTVGGAGKTPVALDLGKRLIAKGRSVHFLTRGYGGRPGPTPLRVDPACHDAATVGDEALLLARVAPTWVSADRVAGAKAARAAGATTLILDDGFQNPRLAYDGRLLVIDARAGFGNGRVLPAGPLREPVADALTRADAVIQLGAPEGAPPDIPRPACPVLSARIVPKVELAWLKNQRVLAFAGLGRPEKLFDTLRAHDADVVETVAFPDHYRYTERDIASLKARATAQEATLVTTEKDAVRLTPGNRRDITTLPVGLVWDHEAALTHFLEPFHTDAAS